MISQPISWHLCGRFALVGGARRQARRSTSSGLAIANVLGTCVQLNSDGLDPTHGLVALADSEAAARVVHCSRFQLEVLVFENLKGRLAAHKT